MTHLSLKDITFVFAKIVYSPMVAKDKETYEAPAMLVVVVKTEGIVCASQEDYLFGGLDEND